MAYEGYECLRIRRERGVAFVTIDHPPINLFDLTLMHEMNRVGIELEADESIRVVVFDSANPDYFIAHADVTLIQSLPTDVPPKATLLSPFHAMVDRFRTMPKATIAQIEGRVRGGGSEFVLSLDMRFGALGRAILSQPEVALGIIPGGSGTQRLPRLMGRGRALEVILGCEDIPADLAERYGYINRALPPEKLAPFVERLAYRIASFPAEAIALAKASVNASELPTIEGLLEEAHYFNQSLATQPAQKRMARFMEIGGQTPQAELDLEPLVQKLSDA
ncbi:MAG: enoyl-CoA hydratase/isomerase family protein [Candidatus Abyssobacteria bacterium SURF_17]|jgi:enoyl-CoA hydratase/carnithine racemase|uniref:Enoyl-CoA hydratase/isomerase family protein n=1 Tax=Candidatus Abyssobacteria bacterium SURF_17 TaxID=2093361 RepID=A0A419F004_9BACT|nr:MAG: enoyl-CoA hydratase/isomerase family protein [Candidatus Abyssubacteria bacterium SURF_17]